VTQLSEVEGRPGVAGICEGRVAIVTGAGRGIGREHALMLASEGAAVVVNDLGARPDGSGADPGPADEVVAEIEAMGGHAIVNGSDVTDFVQAEVMVSQAVEVFGRLDILVNNAGILRDRMVFSMSEQDWDDVVGVHLKGHFCPTRHAAAYWRAESKAGRQVDARIINTASPSGLYGNLGQANYGAAKAGIAALTVITSLEGSRYGVRANAVAPGGATRIVNESMPQIPVVEANEAGEEFQRLNPGNSAPMVVWLASDESLMVSGQVFRAVGNSITRYHGWSLGANVDNVVKGEPTRFDPARLTDVLAKNLFGTRPGGLQMNR